MAVVTRRIQCNECGAPQQVLDDALMVVCERCGAFVAMRSETHWGGDSLAKRHAETLRALVQPTAAQSRKLRAQLAMADAATAGDQDAWRLWAQEYYAMLPVTDPELVPGDPHDSRGVGRWVRCSLEAAWLSTFDPDVRAAQASYVAAAGGLHGRGGDPIAVSREVLAKAEALQQAITEHPRYPRALASSSPAHMAREMLRATLVSAASILGPGVVTRIQHEVLGDERAEAEDLRCPGCGAGLPADHGDQRCPYCGTVLHVQLEDPWRSNLVGLWQTSRRQAKTDDDEALLALTLALSSHLSGGPLAATGEVWRFLGAGPRWLPASSLDRALELMGLGYGEDPEILRWLAALREELPQWSPEGQRPAPSSDAPDHASTGPAGPTGPTGPSPQSSPSEDPWVLQSLALWERTQHAYAGDASAQASAVIGFVMQPFYLGHSITAAQAMAFIGAVEPRPAPAALTDAAELLLRAQVAPAAEPLLRTLVTTLRDHGPSSPRV